jgi:hypothetical protein
MKWKECAEWKECALVSPCESRQAVGAAGVVGNWLAGAWSTRREFGKAEAQEA